MATTLRIYDLVPGQQRPPARTLHLATERVSVAELIRRRVDAEVADHNARRHEVFRGLIQPTGSERVLNGYRVRSGREIDAAEQVTVALAQFERRGFLLLFDNRQVEALDEDLVLTDASEATFVRLVPLVGG